MSDRSTPTTVEGAIATTTLTLCEGVRSGIVIPLILPTTDAAHSELGSS
jgi:hypothetical protein